MHDLSLQIAKGIHGQPLFHFGKKERQPVNAFVHGGIVALF